MDISKPQMPSLRIRRESLRQCGNKSPVPEFRHPLLVLLSPVSNEIRQRILCGPGAHKHSWGQGEALLSPSLAAWLCPTFPSDSLKTPVLRGTGYGGNDSWDRDPLRSPGKWWGEDKSLCCQGAKGKEYSDRLKKADD